MPNTGNSCPAVAMETILSANLMGVCVFTGIGPQWPSERKWALRAPCPWPLSEDPGALCAYQRRPLCPSSARECTASLPTLDPREQRCSGDTSTPEAWFPLRDRRRLSPPLHVPPVSILGLRWLRRDTFVFSSSQRNVDGWPEWAWSWKQFLIPRVEAGPWDMCAVSSTEVHGAWAAVANVHAGSFPAAPRHSAVPGDGRIRRP